MRKKIFVNFIFIIFTYVVPLSFLYIKKEVTLVVAAIVAGIILVGSIFLIYINQKNRKQNIIYKWHWIIFEIIGILGVCYSIFVLFLFFALRNCCSF